MKQFQKISYLLLVVFIASCSSQKAVKTSFTIVQLNDVYEIAPIQGNKFGGMARVETIHQNLVKENKNTMLVLAGDFLYPSLLGTMKVNGNRVRGKQMVEVMNAMNFDVVAFGNHEFDLSYTHLQQRFNESNFQWISSNVRHNINGKQELFYKEINDKKQSLQESYIKEFKNTDGSLLKVGFISACIPSNPKSYVHYGNIYDEIKRTYNNIKNKVDVVIGLTHVTLAQDKKIAELLPDVPLIMGGHEHTNMYHKVGNTIIAKADANAKSVYIHRFEFDPISKKVEFKSELKEVNENVASNKSVAAIVNKWQKVLKSKLQEVVANPNEVIYHATIPLDARETPIRSEQTNMGQVLTKSMSFAFNDDVDCALVNGGSVRIDDTLQGDINAVDIFRVLPYGGAILKVKLKGNLLNEVLEYGENAKGTGAYLHRFNADRVNNEWLIQNKPLNDSKIYTVAFSDYLLKGLDIPILSSKNKDVLDIYKPNETEMAIDIRKAVISYLKKQ